METITDQSLLLDLMPRNARPAGYAWLWKEFNLQAPLREVQAVSSLAIREKVRLEEGVIVRHTRDWPSDSDPMKHVDFALRREHVDLTLLKLAFDAIGKKAITEHVEANPFSVGARRTWFLYEWLNGEQLDLPDMTNGKYSYALDRRDCYTTTGSGLSKRHRIIDNMPGTPEFCPIARRSDYLDATTAFGGRARKVAFDVAGNDRNLIQRAAAHLVLADSRASFEIEGEVTGPKSDDRIRRWARLLGRAGQGSLSLERLDQLQRDIIGNDSFVHAGLRKDAVFLGSRDRYNDPVPEFIGARPEDLPSLMNGLLGADRVMSEDQDFNPIVHSAGLSFGFVYVHPYEDGNGRLHRYIMQHVLAHRQVSPPGVILPVSRAIMDRVVDYAEVLRDHSAPLMDFIPWEKLGNGNLEVTADTSLLYRYPDVTKQARLLAECVDSTISEDLPNEISWLRHFDEATKAIDQIVDMPTNRTSLLINLIKQNGGTLSGKKRKSEFSDLDDNLLTEIEAVVRSSFEMEAKPELGFDSGPGS
jgi:hypothetical protein